MWPEVTTGHKYRRRTDKEKKEYMSSKRKGDISVANESGKRGCLREVLEAERESKRAKYI